jgi:hypothetical protein
MAKVAMQLYNKAGDWVGQFANALAVEKYISESGLDAEDFEIRIEPSKYPST